MEKNDIGQIDIHKRNGPRQYFVLIPGLEPDIGHMLVSQWKQGFFMLPRIGSMPPANDPTYVPQDTLCKSVYDKSTELGYHITKPSANEPVDNKYINARNAISSTYLNFARAVVCKCSRDIVTNCRAHITKTKSFDSQTGQIHAHVGSIQRSLARWIQRNVPILADQLFPNGLRHIETDLNRICTKVIHIENQIRKGVRTGWNGREKGGLWVGQWFVYTMFTGRHRRSIFDFPNSASLEGASLPHVIASEENPSLDVFVRHVQESGYEEGDILHPARHNALHWMGKPISYDVDPDLEDPYSGGTDAGDTE